MRRHFKFDDADRKRAERATSAHHPSPVVNGVAFTEQNPEYALIYEDARFGQFDAKTMRRLPRAWLLYLEAHQLPPPNIVADEWAKLSYNAKRAEIERSRRFRVWLSIFAGVAVVVAASISALATVLASGC